MAKEHCCPACLTWYETREEKTACLTWHGYEVLDLGN